MSDLSPTVVSMMVFLGVSGVIGLLAFVFRDTTARTATRLDLLVGKRRREEGGPDILRQTAFENDKKSLLEWLTPKLFSPKKVFEQADCHIPPSTLFGVSMLMAVLGATVTIMARVPWVFAPMT